MQETNPIASVQPGKVPLTVLATLWFQVGGTICNLSCSHCFISCSPENDKFKMMTLDQIKPYLEEAKSAGVKEFYFTGGEPFLNEEIFEILSASMKIGPTSVLTNGTVISPRRAARLAEIFDSSIYSLEIRVSLDGFEAESNDRLRGKGSFDRAMKGIRNLVTAGLLPIVTAVQTWPDNEHRMILKKFTDILRKNGNIKPRLKIMPALDLGQYRTNSMGDGRSTIVTADMLHGFDISQLLCSSSRMVTHDGVYVCPILIDYPDARLGDSLDEADRPYTMRHPACHTCYLSGAICSNFASSEKSTG